MKLQGRFLQPNLRGDDVKLLQSELRRLNLRTQIVDPEGFFGSTTFLAVQEFQRLHGLEATGTVDQETARLINKDVDEVGAGRFVVRGEVRAADGDPLQGIIVRVFRKGLRRDDLLGQATTVATGGYSVEYQPVERPISLVVQANDPTGNVVATSSVICKARPLEIVDLAPDGASRGPSELKQLRGRLTPILRREQISIEELEAEDVELLACAHDLNPDHVASFVAASRMAREARMEAEAFYALVRQGLPTVLIALVAESTETLRRALEASVDENIVGAQIRDRIPHILRGLQGLIVRLALEEPTPDRPTFRTLLDIAGVPQQHQQTIVTAYVEREGTIAEFWQQLREQHGIDEEQINELQYTIGAAAIALNHPPLVRELTRMRRERRLGRDLRDLARFNRDDWERLIKSPTDSGRIGAPDLLGEKEEERETRYAEFLSRIVETTYPTAVLTHRLAEIDEDAFAPTLAFLRRNPSFDFRSHRVAMFLRDHPHALDGAADRDAAARQLRAVQRMTNIAPPFNKARTVALIADDIDSAFKIRRMGPVQFVRTRARRLGGAAAAKQVYTNAARQSDAALMLLSQSKFFNPVSPGILGSHLFGEGVPDLEDLFGSLDFCQCEHCTSVYSPAAYLVDLLHFLMELPAKTPGRTALDVLFGNPNNNTRRRWDIGEMELTCHNTNTVLPHIDLVNEMLENAVAPSGSFPYQTEGDADALGANPEHVNAQAYKILAKAVYPWSLPFDLWAAEARLYVVRLGVRRDVLMDQFRREGATPSLVDVAAEYLGLTPRERSIINGSAPETTQQMWGMELASFALLLGQRRLPTVLRRSGLSYEELVEVLDVDLVNSTGAMHIEFAGADCNLETAKVTGLTRVRLARLHRFVRLQRKMGWPIAELGDTLAALNTTNLNDATIVWLAKIKRFRETLTTPLETMLAWWPPLLSTQGHHSQPSLYDRIFNDPSVNPPTVNIFQLNNTRKELKNPNQPISEHLTEVSVVLGVGEDDLALLVEGLPSQKLNLANLTKLYKIWTLARALKVTINDYLILRALIGFDPFIGITATESFIERTRLVRESGFDLQTLDYLLRHRSAGSAAMTDAQASEILARLREALLQIAADHEFASDPTGSRTAESLASILPADVVNRAMALLDGTSAEDQASRIALINDHFAQFLDPAQAIIQLVDPGVLKTPEERFDYALERLLVHLSHMASASSVVEGLAGTLGLTSEVAGPLLRELVPSPADANQPILSVFLATEESPEQVAAVHRLAKIALILNAFEIPADQVAFTITRGAELGWLDLNALPLVTQSSAVPLFEQWLAMVTLFRTAAGLPDGIALLFATFADLDNQQLTRAKFLDSLAGRTAQAGWNRKDLYFLTGPGGFALQFRKDFANGKFLTRLKRCFELLAQLGVAAQEAWRWAQPAPTAVIARSIKQTVRARFDDRQQWLSAAKPIRDKLRGEQRTALIAFLAKVHNLEGPDDLYAHFLVDVEMEPCMLTSRLVLATNSVQLFVQRCLLNLEPEVAFTAGDAKEWEWMKNYRVWEANRKIFLYPENWIEPELRDDKSPFFVDLENGLLQDEISDSTVEREYLKYLQDLENVAQLEISGHYRQREADRDIVHVFGRTRNKPHIYYYRRWVDGSYWTPWEHVEADIEGDHLVPVFWNRRLYLFWPMFMEKAEQQVPSNEPENPRRYYEIRIAWSEYRDGKWSPKRVTSDFFKPFPKTDLEGKERFSFWAQFDGDKRLYLLSDIRGKDKKAFTYELNLQQFRFAECNGALEATFWDGSKWDPFDPVAYKIYRRFPGTYKVFNGLREFRGSHRLSVYTAGETISSFGNVGNENLNLNTIKTANLLTKTPGRFSLMLPINSRFIARSPFFYQDDSRTFFVVPEGRFVSDAPQTPGEWTNVVNAAPLELPGIVFSQVFASQPATRSTWTFLPLHWEATAFRFESFYHPYACLLIAQLNRHGIEGILRPAPEAEPHRPDWLRTLRRQLLTKMFFWEEYQPNIAVVSNVKPVDDADNLFDAIDKILSVRPVEEFDFSYGGSYSIYNWELFFHAPFMIAKKLSQNRRFAAAQNWYHNIFDPTYAPVDPGEEKWPQRVWQIKPFFEHDAGKSIAQAMLLLKSPGLTDAEDQVRKSLCDQIDAWRENPFNPHLIARLRNEAYMKTVVMSYLDNLIAWGDHLFQQDTRESINEATQIYILAAEILGERPNEIPAHEGTHKAVDGKVVKTFNQLSGHLDDFSNVLVDLETRLYPVGSNNGGSGLGGGLVPDLPLAMPGVEPPDKGGFVVDLPLGTPIPAILGPTLFFCIPKNDKLLGYWDAVEDRLFKIRHCLNIEGVARPLALFSPPIDPGLLVKAAAAGLDLGTVLSDLNAPPSHYRFQTFAQKAGELVNDVKSLGAALMAALEKKDGEELALLRSSQEIQVLKAVGDLKRRQVDEAKASIAALEASKRVLEERRRFYETREDRSAKERHHLKKLERAQSLQIASQAVEIVRAVFAMFPDLDIGVSGIASPVFKARWGGSNIAATHQAISQGLSLLAGQASYEATKAITESGYERRKEEWGFQVDQAKAESEQIKKQITAAEIRLEIAELDLKNHDLQVENAKSVDELMHNKYTNQDLYGWMSGQISGVHFQSYQLAYALAKRAERAFQFELGVTDTNFITFGYWDSLKKGLLAGERLSHDLKRMEVAYLDQNKREYEITKHISLAMLNPLALITLRATGQCFVEMPETLFDMDYPGHYLRRIKTVSLTIPCVVGPYTGINCTLTMLANSVRRAASPSSPYARDTEGDDPRFADNLGAIQSIATSGGQNDSGLFELNFRDERYLPFEGAGAISRWRIELPVQTNRFDRNTLSDVIIHLRYTAREGGEALRAAALPSQLNGARLFSLRHEFPTEWHRFLHAEPDMEQTLVLRRMDERFPFRRPGTAITIDRVLLLGRFASAEAYTATLTPLVGNDLALILDPELGNMHQASINVQGIDVADWTLQIRRAGNQDAHLEPDEVEDFFMICLYTLSA